MLDTLNTSFPYLQAKIWAIKRMHACIFNVKNMPLFGVTWYKY